MQYGNAVVIDDADIEIKNRIDGQEIRLRNLIDGGEMGAFYNSSGPTDYENLMNKPKINGVTIIGEKVGGEYHLQNKMDEVTPQEIDQIIFGG